MKIFVTGADGFIGQNFVDIINSKKAKDISLFCLTRKKKTKKTKKITWVKGSLNSNLNKYLIDTDIIVHFASIGVQKKKVDYKKIYETNVTHSYKFFKSALDLKINKWIVIGSSSEYGAVAKKFKLLSASTKPQPLSPYAKTKYLFNKKISLLASKNKISLKILRLFPVYGKGENNYRLLPQLYKSIKEKKSFILNNSEERRDYIDVKFAALKILKSIKFKKNEINKVTIKHIASGKCVKNKDFVLKFWRKLKGTNKLIFKKKLNNHLDNIHHCSDKKSLV